MCVEEEDVDLTDMTHGRCEHTHTLVCDGSCCRDIFLWVTLSEQTIVVYSTGRKQISFLFICHIFVVSEIRNNSKNVLQDVSLNLLV